MSEKRNLESIRIFYVWLLITNIVCNIVFYLNIKGINMEMFEVLKISAINSFSFMSLLFLSVVIISSKNLNANRDIQEKINNKIKPLYFINVFFITYILIACFVVKNRDIILSSIVMEIIFLGIFMLTKNILMLGLNSRQLQWKKAWESPKKESKESSILWRFKPWFTPHVNVPFKNRWKGPFRLLYDLALLYAIYITKVQLISFIFVVLLLPDLLSWLEGFLGLQTSLSGICTGITEHHGKSSSSIYHKVYITDYEREREITFFVDGPLFIDEGSNITVVHGIFSKRVLYVEGLRLNIR